MKARNGVCWILSLLLVLQGGCGQEGKVAETGDDTLSKVVIALEDELGQGIPLPPGPSPVRDNISGSFRLTLWSSYIGGRRYVLLLTEDDFRDYPHVSPASEELPVTVREALARATDALREVRDEGIEYELTSIELKGVTRRPDLWYYEVTFRASSSAWRTKEPYRSLLRRGDWSVAWVPRISLAVLMNGRVVRPQLVEDA